MRDFIGGYAVGDYRRKDQDGDSCLDSDTGVSDEDHRVD